MGRTVEHPSDAAVKVIAVCKATVMSFRWIDIKRVRILGIRIITTQAVQFFIERENASAS